MIFIMLKIQKHYTNAEQDPRPPNPGIYSLD
jgi:hypothetical protein